MFQDVEVLDLMILTRPTLLDGILRSLRAESHCSDSDGAISPAELSRLSGEEATLSGRGTVFATQWTPGTSYFGVGIMA